MGATASRDIATNFFEEAPSAKHPPRKPDFCRKTSIHITEDGLKILPGGTAFIHSVPNWPLSSAKGSHSQEPAVELPPVSSVRSRLAEPSKTSPYDPFASEKLHTAESHLEKSPPRAGRASKIKPNMLKPEESAEFAPLVLGEEMGKDHNFGGSLSASLKHIQEEITSHNAEVQPLNLNTTHTNSEAEKPEPGTKNLDNPGLFTQPKQSLRDQPCFSQPDPILSQPGPIFSQPDPILSQPGPIFSQPEPIFSQPEPCVSRPDPSISQPCPSAQSREHQNPFSHMQVPVGKAGGRFSPFMGEFAADRKKSLQEQLMIPAERIRSNIPKAGSSETWPYPSEQMFKSALLHRGVIRAGDVSPPELDKLMQTYNTTVELAWREVLKWEALHADECKEPKLKKFSTFAIKYSPMARIKSWFNQELPFDRHDWIVDRNGKEVRYVVDYVDGGSESSHPQPALLDVKPALDSLQAVWDRVKVRMLRITGGSDDTSTPVQKIDVLSVSEPLNFLKKSGTEAAGKSPETRSSPGMSRSLSRVEKEREEKNSVS